jgi:effector-binding domain-containing protein
MVQNRTPESIIELLSQQEAMLDRRLHELQTAYSTIHVIRRNIQNGLLGRPGEVRVESLDEIKFVLGPANDFGDDKTYYRTFERFCSLVNEYRINLDYPIGGYYYDMDSFLKTPGRPNKYFSMDPAGNCTRPAGTYLVGYNQGYYGNLRDLPQKMAAYAQEHELVFSGPVYVVYLLNEISTKDSDQYLSRISASVSTKRNNHSFVPSRTADEKYG